MAEVIFLQTDPNFSLVLQAMKELRDKKRLPLKKTTVQRAWITRIKAAVYPEYIWDRMYDFSRTASACFRMAMLEATGIPRDWWPTAVSTKANTHRDNMGREPDPVRFHLAADKDKARTYWSHYDQLYPHYTITEKYDKTNADESVPLNSMMVIFREGFTEMIEITTTVQFQKDLPSMEHREFNVSVNVVCIKREIEPGDDKLTPAFDLLQRYEREHQDVEKNKETLLEESRKETSKLVERIAEMAI